MIFRQRSLRNRRFDPDVIRLKQPNRARRKYHCAPDSVYLCTPKTITRNTHASSIRNVDKTTTNETDTIITSALFRALRQRAESNRDDFELKNNHRYIFHVDFKIANGSDWWTVSNGSISNLLHCLWRSTDVWNFYTSSSQQEPVAFIYDKTI